MTAYKVLRHFDNYAAGDVMSPADVLDQERRGNIPSLLRENYIAALGNATQEEMPSPTFDNLSYRELQRMAKAQDIPANQSREDLIEALSNGDN